MATVASMVPRGVSQDYAAMKMSFTERRKAMGIIAKAREGNYQDIAPDLFSERFPHSHIANFIDVVTHDLADVIGQIPSLSCASGNMKTETDKRRASRKNRIGAHYWWASDLETQLLLGADQYMSCGFLPMYVEPDFEKKLPTIFLEDPFGCYYENDRWGCTKKFAKCWDEKVWKLAIMFPEAAAKLTKDQYGREDISRDARMEVVRYCDDKMTYLFVPQRGNVLLDSYSNPLSECPVTVIERPGLRKGKPRGQFDDVVWVQIARAYMVRLAMDAGEKSVNSPLVVPRDVVEFNVGDDSIIQTDNPQGVGKVRLDVPPAVFSLTQELSQDMEIGSRYPNARTGNVDASVITGKGVDALMGSFNTQVRSAQVQFSKGLARVTTMCFKMDQTLWPNLERTIEGTTLGESYKEVYTPKKDIAGAYNCNVDYGFAYGQSQAQAMVMMLQLQGAGILSVETIQRNTPLPINAEEESRNIDVDELRKMLKAAVGGYAQALPALAQQGQDPMQIVSMITSLIKGRQDDKSIEDTFSKFLTKQAADAAQAAQEQAQQAGPGGGPPGADALAQALGGGAPPGAGPGGPPQGGPGGGGIAPQNAGGVQGAPRQETALPDIQTLVSAIRGGKPVSDATTIRRQTV